jgi:hypothetical protein
MTRLARIDFDAVAPLMPFDKTAAQVASKGEHFHWEPTGDQLHSELPIRTRQATPREISDPGYVDLTGAQIGRLRVAGIASFSSLEKRRWVVRCQCGDYEIRRAKFIKRCLSGENPVEPMCMECGYTRKLQQGFHNEKKAAAAAEAIQNSIR